MNKDAIKGKGAVGVAISYYALNGLVSIPLEAHDYNLIFDDGKCLYKVKVISCAYKTKHGVYTASIKTCGGNQPNSSTKKFDAKTCDLVFIVTDELIMYEIPSDAITSSNAISLNVYASYEVILNPK